MNHVFILLTQLIVILTIVLLVKPSLWKVIETGRRRPMSRFSVLMIGIVMFGVFYWIAHYQT